MGKPKKRLHSFGLAGGIHGTCRQSRHSQAVCSTAGTSDTFIDHHADKSSHQHSSHRYSYSIFKHSHFRFTIKRRPKRKIEYKQPTPISEAEGFRIIHLNSLKKHEYAVAQHVATCRAARKIAKSGRCPVLMLSEGKSLGLACILHSKCIGCNLHFKFNTSPLITFNTTKRHEINVRAVWGQMATGGGAATLNEVMATMGSPGMSQHTFTAVEEDISKAWKGVLEEEMIAAREEEKDLAFEQNRMYQDLPACSAVCDGGWSKRTHKHSYNALGGAGIIVGLKTKKILHLGVRNKYCIICTTANTRQQDPPPHQCFQNWNDSSQAMESDIMVEGLNEIKKTSDLIVKEIIADGDSSTYAAIQANVPWGRDVEKIECANHACKCLRSSLEKLVEAKPHYKGINKLSKPTRVRLTTAVRCAIRMRSKQPDRQTAIRKLESDIMNSVYHVFGKHNNCDSYFCKVKCEAISGSSKIKGKGKGKTSEKQALPVTDNIEDEDDGTGTTTECFNVMDAQVQYWAEGSSLAAQEESRSDCPSGMLDISQEIINDVRIILRRLADKSSRLIENATSNLAECWMSVRSKFDGGKVINRCGRGSWYSRCYGAALRLNVGPEWSPIVWEKTRGQTADRHFRKHYIHRGQATIKVRQQKKDQQFMARVRKRKLQRQKQASTKKARQSYGDSAIDVTEDAPPLNLITSMKSFYDEEVTVKEEKRQYIELNTRDQSTSNLWHEERRKRVTASVFGDIVTRRTSTPSAPLVKRLLYATFKGNIYTRHGLSAEPTTVQEYILEKAKNNISVKVTALGLVIHREHHFMAASPDGMVTELETGDTGLLEVKNLLYNKRILLKQAAKSSSFCLKFGEGKLHLRHSHKYYHQCQGLLNITEKPWIDFVVRVEKPYQLFIERIWRDLDKWEDMVAKLSSFYFRALLPELASPREGQQPGIREPNISHVSFKNNK